MCTGGNMASLQGSSISVSAGSKYVFKGHSAQKHPVLSPGYGRTCMDEGQSFRMLAVRLMGIERTELS